MNLTQQEKNILYVLKQHEGEANAITFSNLATKVRMNDRELRATVADMIVVKHLPCGTSSGAGYYLLNTLEECRHCSSEAWSRSHKLRERGQAYDEIEKKYFNKAKQLTLG